MVPPIIPYIKVPPQSNFSCFVKLLKPKTLRKPTIGKIKVINVPVKAP